MTCRAFFLARSFAGLWLAALLLVMPGISLRPGQAACTIVSSPCYPWRIEEGQTSTVLLEIVPNNAPTAALYRVCLCPPTKDVSLIFDFEGKQVAIGKVELGSGEPVCRDYRLATARKSRLLLRRPDGGKGLVEGCYTTQ